MAATSPMRSRLCSSAASAGGPCSTSTDTSKVRQARAAAPAASRPAARSRQAAAARSSDCAHRAHHLPFARAAPTRACAAPAATTFASPPTNWATPRPAVFTLKVYAQVTTAPRPAQRRPSLSQHDPALIWAQVGSGDSTFWSRLRQADPERACQCSAGIEPALDSYRAGLALNLSSEPLSSIGCWHCRPVGVKEIVTLMPSRGLGCAVVPPGLACGLHGQRNLGRAGLRSSSRSRS